MSLSEEEKQLLKKYQDLSSSLPDLINRLAVEIIPPIIFMAMGIYTGQILWFILVIIIMVSYNVFRVIKQRKYIQNLKSISEKTIGKASDNEKN